jgi:predicted DNA-binding ribbon-helix-helix protein
MKSSIVKRSIVIAGRKTSISLEDVFWKAFNEIADERHVTKSELAAAIDADRQQGNLSSAIRLFVLGQHRDQIANHQGMKARADVGLASLGR